MKHTLSPNNKASYHYKLRAFLWLILATVLVIATVFGYTYWFEHKNLSLAVSDQTTYNRIELSDSTDIPAAVTLPDSVNLNIPYAPQAPLSNWKVHEESCEEAATYMYRAYLLGIKYPGNRIPDTEADTAFRDMKTWQVSHYGSEPDLTMVALGTFASSYYGFFPTVKKNISENDIKTAIAAGHPVVVPVMTHSLENTMYGPVSVYHVLLIKGYDATGVITNDAGVGNGVNKHYNWKILWQAIDAQTAKINQGREMLTLTSRTYK